MGSWASRFPPRKPLTFAWSIAVGQSTAESMECFGDQFLGSRQLSQYCQAGDWCSADLPAPAAEHPRGHSAGPRLTALPPSLALSCFQRYASVSYASLEIPLTRSTCHNHYRGRCSSCRFHWHTFWSASFSHSGIARIQHSETIH